MKQLDLFGSFTEPVKEETIQQEHVVAEAKPVEENPVPIAETITDADNNEHLLKEEPVENIAAAKEATTIAVTEPAVDDWQEIAAIESRTSNQITEENIIENEPGFAEVIGEEDAAFMETAPVEDIILAAKEAAEESLNEAEKEPADDIVALEENSLFFANDSAEFINAEMQEAPVVEIIVTEKPSAPAQTSSIIFEDDKIAVKLKIKQPPPPVEPEVQYIITEPEKRPVLIVVKKRGRKSFKEIDAEVDLVEVPDDDILFDKQYYSISQVATWFHVNTSLVRYWENEFDILKPRKNRKGDRLFRPEDVKNLQVIYYLLRQRKFSIEGAKKYLKDNKKTADTNIQLIQSLTKFRGFLLELKANLGA